MQSTMRYVYLVDTSRSGGATGNNAGRGIAIRAKTLTTSHCDQKSHLVRNCWKKCDVNKRKSTGAHRKQTNKESSKVKTDKMVQLSRINVLYSNIPLPTTQNITRREHHARRRKTTLTTYHMLLDWARAHLPLVTMQRRLSTLPTTSTWHSRYRAWWPAAEETFFTPTSTGSLRLWTTARMVTW